jgi:hypothetical protein
MDQCTQRIKLDMKRMVEFSTLETLMLTKTTTTTSTHLFIQLLSTLLMEIFTHQMPQVLKTQQELFSLLTRQLK